VTKEDKEAYKDRFFESVDGEDFLEDCEFGNVVLADYKERLGMNRRVTSGNVHETIPQRLS